MSTKKAGYIYGSPTAGLDYRECIEVTKVYDGCLSRIGDQQFVITIPPVPGVPPYTFVSLTSSGTTTLSNLIINPLEGASSRVSFDATVPLTVSFTDSTGASFTAPSSITFHRDVILRLPVSSVMPYSISVTTSVIGNIGTFLSPTEISCRVCILQISKVTVMVDMLVPSYGYCSYPDCGEDDVCRGLMNLPLFPPLV